MRRVLALLLVPIFSASPGFVPRHLHEYVGHDHPEHHHGLAAHEHHYDKVAHTDDPHLVWESCDPAQHVVSVSTGCISLPNLYVSDSACGNCFISERLVLISSIQTRVDVRVHGPPSGRLIPSRAPPLAIHA
jgi:hypothetical protein